MSQQFFDLPNPIFAFDQKNTYLENVLEKTPCPLRMSTPPLLIQRPCTPPPPPPPYWHHLIHRIKKCSLVVGR